MQCRKTGSMQTANTEDYGVIFDGRGASYDRAMRIVPDARNLEFEHLLKLAELKRGEVVCDFPAGGGYIADRIARDVDLTLMETSTVFFDLCNKRPNANARLVTEDNLGFVDHFDKILSLAGSHHMADRAAFFASCHHALKARGKLCLADVAANSRVAVFLNEFVDLHCTGGHEGIFIDDQALDEIKAAGFSIEIAQRKSYPWIFSSVDEMARYCGLLFGIDDLAVSEIRNGLEHYLGYRETESGVLLNWGLYFIRAVKSV
jgi:SAM-dependent methyltransferase